MEVKRARKREGRRRRRAQKSFRKAMLQIDVNMGPELSLDIAASTIANIGYTTLLESTSPQKDAASIITKTEDITSMQNTSPRNDELGR